jgi:YfiH family protein
MQVSDAVFSVSDGGRVLYSKMGIGTDCGTSPSLYLSTLAGGDMKPGNNPRRSAFFRRIGVDPAQVTAFRQSHSLDVAFVPYPPEPIYAADGGVAQDGRIILSITVADCLPIFLFDRSTGCFALVHSGWKGTGIAVRAVDLMTKELGSAPASIEAVIGPGISACCYDIDAGRAAKFENIDNSCVVQRGAKTYLDLKAANRYLLRSAGVGVVRTSTLCTGCTSSLGSFRRQGPDRFVRMVAVIGFF